MTGTGLYGGLGSCWRSAWLRALVALCFSLMAGALFAQVADSSPVAKALNASDLAPADRAAVMQYLSAYKLGPADVITVRVFGEEDLSREKIRLTDGGTIFVPGIGELPILGRTLGEVEKLVADGLRGRILVNPQVSVFVEEYRPFYINGMVEKAGGYPWQPGLSVRKAAALAGGFRERASLSKIYLIRSDDGAQRAQKVDLNMLVFPGDIVTVEESFF